MELMNDKETVVYSMTCKAKVVACYLKERPARVDGCKTMY